MREDIEDAGYNEIMRRIYFVAGVRTQTELANVLGIRQSSISEAKKRRSVPSDWLISLLRRFHVNPDWILHGRGAQFMRASSERPQERTFQLYAPSPQPDTAFLRQIPVQALAEEIVRRTSMEQ